MAKGTKLTREELFSITEPGDPKPKAQRQDAAAEGQEAAAKPSMWKRVQNFFKRSKEEDTKSTGQRSDSEMYGGFETTKADKEANVAPGKAQGLGFGGSPKSEISPEQDKQIKDLTDELLQGTGKDARDLKKEVYKDAGLEASASASEYQPMPNPEKGLDFSAAESRQDSKKSESVKTKFEAMPVPGVSRSKSSDNLNKQDVPLTGFQELDNLYKDIEKFQQKPSQNDQNIDKLLDEALSGTGKTHKDIEQQANKLLYGATEASPEDKIRELDKQRMAAFAEGPVGEGIAKAQEKNIENDANARKAQVEKLDKEIHIGPADNSLRDDQRSAQPRVREGAGASETHDLMPIVKSGSQEFSASRSDSGPQQIVKAASQEIPDASQRDKVPISVLPPDMLQSIQRLGGDLPFETKIARDPVSKDLKPEAGRPMLDTPEKIMQAAREKGVTGKSIDQVVNKPKPERTDKTEVSGSHQEMPKVSSSMSEVDALIQDDFKKGENRLRDAVASIPKNVRENAASLKGGEPVDRSAFASGATEPKKDNVKKLETQSQEQSKSASASQSRE